MVPADHQFVIASAMTRKFACTRCSVRKVKCDLQSPCSGCTRHSVECIYRAPKAPRRRRARPEIALFHSPDAQGTTTTGSETMRYQPMTPINRSGIPKQGLRIGAKPIGERSQVTKFKPTLLCGRNGSKFVDNNLWMRVLEEFQESEEETLVERGPVDIKSTNNIYSNDLCYTIDCNPSLKPLHPPTPHIHLLWRYYVKNVDPLVKVLHVPSFEHAIEKAAANLQVIPSGIEALMFAIYSLAVLSLSERDCQDLFEEDRKSLRARYVASTKTCLCRANFMSTNSLIVLQALVLHIVSIRTTCDPRTIWSLNGLALRIAEGMGLAIDGQLLGLSPFETEIRRRVWWQIKMHDLRAAELAGQSKFRGFDLTETTPKCPANANDSDLHRSMEVAPPDSTRLTDMMWSIVRADMAVFAHTQMTQMHKGPARHEEGTVELVSEVYAAWDDLQTKDKFIAGMEDMIETKHLRYCDPAQPLHFLTLLGTRLALTFVKFTAHHPRRWAKMDDVPVSEQDYVWGLALQMLEYYNMLQSTPQLQLFAWNVYYHIQWHVVIHVLDTLKADPLRQESQKAWRLIDALYKHNPEMLEDLHKPIIWAVGNLCLKAYHARDPSAEGERQFRSLEYIERLEKMRAEAKSRSTTRVAKNPMREYQDGTFRALGNHATVYKDTTSSQPGVTVSSTQPSSASEPMPELHQRGAVNHALTDDDAFWLHEDFDNGINCDNEIDGLNLGTSTESAEKDWLQAFDVDGVDWLQWDAWIGTSDSLYPFAGTMS